VIKFYLELVANTCYNNASYLPDQEKMKRPKVGDLYMIDNILLPES